ncbi:GNAT family N-acetyltransferase [Paracoccus sp. WLY502]|uniref:GNAT family N-acetyltransferase n=1 Tax=Paracoccus yibinensis TaxID=3068891 RepID=UPI002796A53A|nr:GNAT family N-acetyltransferase [Paracoccus sp. WLY502]MDQ1902363.1 GNAT family N-acetyltransferase [Paracoccus sp. WLY502]
MTIEIIPATEAMVAEIELWLDEEEMAYNERYSRWEAAGYEGDPGIRGFKCNWNSTKNHWRDGFGSLDVLVKDGRAIGFLDGYDILEIHPQERGLGYGRLLAEFMIDRAQEEGRSVVEIDIAPLTALPFWERLGFKVIEGRQGNGGGQYAYKTLPRRFPLGSGTKFPYAVEFYTETARYTDGKPFRIYSGSGEAQDNGTLQLPERVICFSPSVQNTCDCFAKLTVNGEELFFEKLKRDEASHLGFNCDKGYIYYIERITISSAVCSI